MELNRKLRAAYLAGANDHKRGTRGTPLSDEELRAILPEYPGDLPSER